MFQPMKFLKSNFVGTHHLLLFIYCYNHVLGDFYDVLYVVYVINDCTLTYYKVTPLCTELMFSAELLYFPNVIFDLCG